MKKRVDLDEYVGQILLMDAPIVVRRSLGQPFRRFWGAYAASAFGTWLGFGALPIIAITVLHSGPSKVSLLAAGSLAAGAIAAVPIGSWVEFREKRGVMIGMDLIRFCALISIPAAYALDRLSFVQLLGVLVVMATANTAFIAASNAYLKTLVSREELLIANARLESTTWMATIVGPPIGGIAMGILGPVATIVADAVSYLLSALGIGTIKREDTHPKPMEAARRLSDLLDGWRYVLAHQMLRRLFLNSVIVNALIMATSPVRAVLLLSTLGFTPWEYGLSFGLPCIGGLIGSQIAAPLVARVGQSRALLLTGTLRVLWSIGLAFVGRGPFGLAYVIAVQFGLMMCCGAFNPISATLRLEQIESHQVARTLSAWSITNNLATATLTVVFGLLASLTSPRLAIGLAGLLLLATPTLLPRKNHRLRSSSQAAPTPT